MRLVGWLVGWTVGFMRGLETSFTGHFAIAAGCFAGFASSPGHSGRRTGDGASSVFTDLDLIVTYLYLFVFIN